MAAASGAWSVIQPCDDSIVLKASEVPGKSRFTVGHIRHVCERASGYRAGRAAAILSQGGLKFQTEILGCAEP